MNILSMISVAEIGKTIAEKVVDTAKDTAENKAMGIITGELEEYLKNQSFDKITEALKDEAFKIQLNKIGHAFDKELHSSSLFSEAELRDWFNKYCEENKLTKDDADLDFLYNWFKVVTLSACAEAEKEVSVGEKRILERTEGVLKKKDFDERFDSYERFVKEYIKRDDGIYLSIKEDKSAYIKDFEYKYLFYNSSFDFAESHDFYDNHLYVMSFIIGNAGRSVINSICISNLLIDYCEEIYDDNPECGYYIDHAVKTDKSITKKVYILPGCEKMVHFIFRARDVDLDDEQKTFYDYFEYDQMDVLFGLEVTTEEGKKASYNVCMAMAKTPGKTITGEWFVNEVMNQVK